jgi:hypothetical protein
MKKSSLSHAVRLALALVMLLAPLVAPSARHSSAAAPSSAPFVSFTQVADSSTAISGGTGTFTNFPYSPALDGGNAALAAFQHGSRL